MSVTKESLPHKTVKTPSLGQKVTRAAQESKKLLPTPQKQRPSAIVGKTHINLDQAYQNNSSSSSVKEPLRS